MQIAKYVLCGIICPLTALKVPVIAKISQIISAGYQVTSLCLQEDNVTFNLHSFVVRKNAALPCLHQTFEIKCNRDFVVVFSRDGNREPVPILLHNVFWFSRLNCITLCYI